MSESMERLTYLNNDDNFYTFTEIISRMVLKNVSLKKLNTFGIGCTADYFIRISSETEAVQEFRMRDFSGERLFIIGGGSNLLFTDNFHGTLINPVMADIQVDEDNSEDIIVTAAAGVTWDNFVGWAVSRDLSGVENLSLIPGSVGAAPVQNIGAYGMEVRDSIVRVRAVNINDGNPWEFTNEECMFGYRHSIFKKELKGKYLITKVTFRLKKKHNFKLDYGFLKEEVASVGEISLKNIREAVIRIRSSKLPDPAVTGNAGSFFKNPVISLEESDRLKFRYPLAPAYPDPSGGMKIAAGWLVEQCGWKGKRIGDAGVHPKQALVLVNHGSATGLQILDLSEKIRASVIEKFGISLDREVEVL